MHPASSADAEDENLMANSQEGVSSLGIKNLNSYDSKEGSQKQQQVVTTKSHRSHTSQK